MRELTAVFCREQLRYSPLMGEEKSPDPGFTLPPLNAIRAFEAAGRRVSFVEAARDLGVTHWAIGKQIKLLEDWLGTPLFERRARGVALTGEGAELLVDVSAAFATLSDASRKLRRPHAARRISGLVRVNVPTSFALHWLIPRLSQFQGRFPNVEIRISTTSRKLRYIGSAFDLGVRLGAAQPAGLKSEILMRDRRLPACSPEILRNRPVKSVDDLNRHTLLHSATTRTDWSEWLAIAGRPTLPTVRHVEFEHVHLQLQAAVDGLGIALASIPLIESDIAAGRLICPIAGPHWRAENYLLVSEDRDENAAVKAFRAWITATAASSPADVASA
jgi:LysR family transcriptional regulator, glycine cleavage system transcriptional activator